MPGYLVGMVWLIFAESIPFLPINLKECYGMIFFSRLFVMGNSTGWHSVQLFDMNVRTFETISGLTNVQMVFSCLSLLSHQKV